MEDIKEAKEIFKLVLWIFIGLIFIVQYISYGSLKYQEKELEMKNKYTCIECKNVLK